MFNNLQSNTKWSSKNAGYSRYLLYFLIAVLIIVLSGQLIAQLFTVRQFNRVTGMVVKEEIRRTSYGTGDRFKKGEPNYSLIITLDNNHIYYVDLDRYSTIETILKKQDKVTIYIPTTIYNVLSLDILEFGNSVSQVELGNNILVDFNQHKRKSWPFISYTIIAIGIFFYLLRRI